MTLPQARESYGTKYTEAELVELARARRPLREFADYLNEGLPEGSPGRITYSSVHNWIHGSTSVNYGTLLAWRTYYEQGDLRNKLAVAILDQRMHGGEQ